MTTNIVTGCNKRIAFELARDLGCCVEPKRRTGEMVVSHPAFEKHVLISTGRKDASRALTGFLRKVARIQNR